MKVLVIGQSGQMAQALKAIGGDVVRCIGRPAIDLAKPESIIKAIQAAPEDVVINAAAYTNVDGAETEQSEAFLLNEAGPMHLAAACRDAGLPLIHLSTDCVFDGTLDRPYRPSDPVAPIGVYGRSKWAGEVAVSKAWSKTIIVRVSWIFSQYANNFVRTMLRLAVTRESVSVVSDQQGCPTYAPDLAKGLLRMAATMCEPQFEAWGIYHLAGQGNTTRAKQAEIIFEISRAQGGVSAMVNPICTKDYPTPAQRPLNARLNCQSTQDVFGVCLAPWQEGMLKTIKALRQETETR